MRHRGRRRGEAAFSTPASHKEEGRRKRRGKRKKALNQSNAPTELGVHAPLKKRALPPKELSHEPGFFKLNFSILNYLATWTGCSILNAHLNNTLN
jgi:hypothetical protein